MPAKFDPTKGHSAQYIATHIARIEGEYAANPTLQHDSMWRIASHCDLFPPKELKQQLTDAQVGVVKRFISDFKASHQKLITKCKEARL